MSVVAVVIRGSGLARIATEQHESTTRHPRKMNGAEQFNEVLLRGMKKTSYLNTCLGPLVVVVVVVVLH